MRQRIYTTLLILIMALDVLGDLIRVRMMEPGFKEYYEANWAWTESIWKIMIVLSIVLGVRILFPKLSLRR